MMWYIVLALFWTSAIIYVIGLAFGIFKFEQTHTTIQYAEQTEEEQQVMKDRQLANNKDEARVLNMESMF